MLKAENTYWNTTKMQGSANEKISKSEFLAIKMCTGSSADVIWMNGKG